MPKIKEEFHLIHAFTVEGVMRYFARKLGEDEEYWGIIGLLHDIDFEQYTEETRSRNAWLEAR